MRKAYDQMRRLLSYVLAGRLGMPTKIIWTQQSFMEGAVYSLTLGGRVGCPRTHICSLLQGDALSQIFLDATTVVWHNMLASNDAIPRSLADDISYEIHDAHNHSNATIKSMQLTIDFVNDTGGEISSSKRHMFANTKALTAVLIHKGKTSFPQPMAVLSRFRDLGAAMDLSKANTASTLIRRVTAAVADLHKAMHMHLQPRQRTHYIMAKTLPAALYGVEVTQPSMKVLAALNSVITTFLAPMPSTHDLQC